MTEFKKYLTGLRACAESLEWAGDRTAEQAWGQCERPDWLLWWAARAGADRKAIVRVACLFAREALPYVKAGELRPLRAIESAEAWCDGRATLAEVRAAYAAYAAYAAGAAADAAAADAAAAYARYSEKWRKAKAAKWRAMADIVREHIPCPVTMEVAK